MQSNPCGWGCGIFVCRGFCVIVSSIDGILFVLLLAIAAQAKGITAAEILKELNGKTLWCLVEIIVLSKFSVVIYQHFGILLVYIIL